MGYYIGFEYMDGRNTTTGEPNKHTGRYNIAGRPRLFKTLAELGNWIDEPTDKRRERVTKRELRSLQRGYRLHEFKQDFEQMIFDVELEHPAKT